MKSLLAHNNFRHMTNTCTDAINKYLMACKNEGWLSREADKFLFANHIYNSINWESQTNEEIFHILIESQKQKYTGRKGIKFILKSGREKAGVFLSLSDVTLLKKAKIKPLNKIDWSKRTMSFTGGISVWVSTLFPEKYYPIPMRNINEVVRYLYNPRIDVFPKNGLDYITKCQSFCEQSHALLKQFPLEELYLEFWNALGTNKNALTVSKKDHLGPVDWVWLTQDFHLFVLDRILGKFGKEKTDISPVEFEEPTIIEGGSKLATHMRYERNASLIKKIKAQALKENKMLNCVVCNFSFLAQYGELGLGFIEAHHIYPLSEREGAQVTRKSDIALVCSNCHRMLHRDSEMTIKKLKDICVGGTSK